MYEATDDTEVVPHNPEPAVVFVHAGQQSAEGVAPELLHGP